MFVLCVSLFFQKCQASAQLASLDHVNVTPHAHVPAALTRFPTESEVDAAATHAIAAASTPMNDVNLALLGWRTSHGSGGYIGLLKME